MKPPHSSTCKGECSWIFSELEEKGKAVLRAMAKTITYAKGELIFQEAEPAFGFYVICEGKVKLAKHSPHGKKQILKLLGPCELLGEKTMFDHEVYTAYAQTLERTRVNFFQREQFLEFLKHHTEVALKVIEKLSREIKGFQDKLMETSYEGSQERLARLLLLMAKEYGIPESKGTYIGIELSRQELAELAGISTETAIRMLSRFKERGFIELEGHKIYIVNEASLSALAEVQISPKENLL